uniref:Monodehydroascorbate reductase n=1 Tax=Tanacetum cinerariifolium TaxID=118510 RepID=A0A699JPU4_TANCI|nr:hypothetical protein [Tanacetum cinerariifolium]
MATTIDQQVALDEALVASMQRLRIGRSNFRLPSNIQSKESTLQVVYDVLRNSPFFRAFQVTADVPEIYMQEFWATAKLHHNSIHVKMDTKKSVLDLEAFREMLHISPRIPSQSFAELPSEEEILEFLKYLGHSYDSLRISQAQILWGLYHKRNVDFAYLLWEDFIYQVEHKDTKKSNEMYYPRNSKAYKGYYAVATRATPPNTKVSVQKTKSSSDTTVTPPPTAAAGPRLSTSAKGKQPAKASKSKSLTALSEVAMTETEQLKLATKRSLQQTHISQASGSGADEGTGTIPGVPDVPTKESGEEISWKSSDEEGSNDQSDDDAQDKGDDDDDQEEETRDEKSFDPIAKTPKNTDDEENLDLNIGREEGQDDEDDEDELYGDVNINLEGRVVQMVGVHTTREVEDSHVTLTPVNPDGFDSIFETTSQMDVQAPTIVAPLPLSTPALTPSTIASISTVPQAPTPPTTTLKNDEFLKNNDENIQKIVKKQVKEQVKIQVFKILPKIEQTMNEQLEAKVLTQSSNSSKTSYAVAADLSKMELKKILIEKMEGNKSIH